MAKIANISKVAVIEGELKKYNYVLYDDDIKVGDEVLVSGVNKDVVKIKEIISFEEALKRYHKNITEEVVCKVDRTSYLQRVQNRKEAASLQKKMDLRIKELYEMNKYSIYAEKDERIKEMFSKYLELI